jgi:ubiquinone/menaquinone biosynthesis C-methylase UbiE
MAYTVDESDLARQEGLAEILDPITKNFLGDLPLPHDATCLDVGCGLGNTTMLLARSLRDAAHIVGVDADPDLLEAAREAAGSESVVEFREADAADLPFAENTFDVVFGRFLLAHVSDPAAVVGEYCRVARDGGLILVQEPDFQSFAVYPHSPAYEQSKDVTGELFDIEMGRKCWRLLWEAGVEDLHLQADVPVEAGQEARTLRDQSVRSISAIGPAAVQMGLETEAEMKDRTETVRETAAEDDRFMMFYTTVSVAGRVMSRAE